MEALTYTEVRKNFSRAMDSVCDNHTQLIITRQKSRPVVMMSLEDYNSLKETLFLFQHPANAKRLVEAMEDLRQGKATERKFANATI